MGELHLTQVGFIKPIIDELRNNGINVDRLTHKAGLARFSLGDEESYLPVNLVYKFFEIIDREQGIDDCMANFGETIQLLSLAQWGAMIAYAPDLLAACQLATKYDDIINTHERAGFKINGNQTTYWQYFIDEPRKERKQLVFIDLALVINSLFLALGKDWAPTEIYIQSNTAPNLDSLLPPGYDTKIYLNQPITAVVFPTSSLTSPMLGNKENSNTSIYNQERINSLTKKIENILESANFEAIPNIDYISDIADISSRTLRRRLRKEGTSYFEIIDRWRLKSALNLLSDENKMIKEISQILKYSNVSNFQRAFRRWTKTTPQNYRNLI